MPLIMTSATQFSLEEENFYKDIQDLLKKGSQNEKQLSTFLQRYMDLLARADLDDETFIINFTKAALILEASAKVYGTKVDRLWISLEQVLEALKTNRKNQNNKKKGDNEEDVEDAEGEVPADDAEPTKKLPNPKRRKRLGDGLSSPDDFLEIDNISGLLGKNMNQHDGSGEVKLKFHEEIPNLFIRNKSERKRVDVCLVQSADDRDDSRLRDWIVSTDNMLVKEIYIAQNLNGSDLFLTSVRSESHSVRENIDISLAYNSENEMVEGEGAEPEHVEHDNVENSSDDRNNNTESVPDTALQEGSPPQQVGDEELTTSENREGVVEGLNRSQEVDVGKFQNVYLRRLEDCLVDVKEVFWNSTKFQDVIPSKKMRVKKMNRIPCKLCVQKTSHYKKNKRCLFYNKNPCLDSYFSSLAQPSVTDPAFGILPDEELLNAFRIETKLIEQLGRIDDSRNKYEAHHPDDKDEGVDFLGFDGTESRLMRREASYDEHDLLDDEIAPDVEEELENVPEPEPEQELGLPMPSTENSIRATETFSADVCSVSSDPVLERSRLEYQDIITGELKNQEAAKSSFERNKEMGMKIANWHSSLVRKIEVSQKRGALNVNALAGKVLKSFPACDPMEKPVISFRALVRGRCKRDIPRYFFACLQLTNERNVDIFKCDDTPLATDCMMIRQLRRTRVRHELDEYSNSTSPKKIDSSRSSLKSSSNTPSKRKRNSESESSSGSFEEEPVKKRNKKTNKISRSGHRKRRASSDYGPEKRAVEAKEC